MWLALDACTSIGTAAVFDGAQLLTERAVAMRGATEERLMPAVVGAVEASGGFAAIERIVVGAGPGSFTSLRIAAAIGKGLATSLGVPLWAMPSLPLIVAGAPEGTLAPGRYLATLDAMRGEVFAQAIDLRHDGGIERVASDVERIAAGSFPARAESLGARTVGPSGAVDIVAAPHVRGAARLVERGLAAPVDLAAWEPLYGRLAEAQVKWETTHGRALGAER